uniref:Putative secreted peptide n=1 Tax=Amblyomma aureolatum TaxID=187763 RepID=A0A1E1XHS6_9ACAR
MLADRLRGLLLGILLAVACVCESAPSGSKDAKEGSTTPSTALMVIPQQPLPDKVHKPTADNATTASEDTATTTTANGTAMNHTATNTTAAPEAAVTTVHSGDAVLHYGSGGDSVEKKPQHPTYFFSSWITWREDNYLMSILIPIACGVAAAVLILCSLACIGCCRRRCRSRNRRKLHRKIDPKTFRKMKAADRIKLLAASSDEEF